MLLMNYRKIVKLYFGPDYFFVQLLVSYRVNKMRALRRLQGNRRGREGRAWGEGENTREEEGRGVNSAAVADCVQGQRMAWLQNGEDGLQGRATRERNICSGVAPAMPDEIGVRRDVLAETTAVSWLALVFSRSRFYEKCTSSRVFKVQSCFLR